MNQLERETIFGVVNVLMKLLDLNGTSFASPAGATEAAPKTASADFGTNGLLLLETTAKEVMSEKKKRDF